MAGDWIKMRTNLRTHPKVVRISSALKADRLRVIGGLHAVWCLFDAHSTDGRLDGYTAETLDEDIAWPGFSTAMIAVEWLVDDGASLSTPGFDEHNGQSAKRRAQEAERKRTERKTSAQASASDADEKRTREEKRREDTEEEKTSAGEAPERRMDQATVPKVERRKGPQPSEEDYACARKLFGITLNVNAQARKPNWDTWANEVRMMREIDKRTHEGIEELFHWAKHDGFWCANIQSPGKLREKWDMLTERRKSPDRRSNGRPSMNAGFIPGADDDIFNQMRTE